jgi:tRNA nucleotidyltransferase (CCA-adding enzyme)
MNQLEKFGHKIFFLLVENFPQSFFVGGMVRDSLLGRKITDIDIATSARPQEVAFLLREHQIIYDEAYAAFGVIVARQESYAVEIASFRKEAYGSSRYPKISYTKEVKADAARRDFTVNALYLQPKSNKILDYFGGQKDIKNQLVRFIGNPKKRIQEDPLRIIRALRFCLQLNFKLEQKTKLAIKNNFNLIKTLTNSKLEKEIRKLKNKKQETILQKVINRPLALDKYFK